MKTKLFITLAALLAFTMCKTPKEKLADYSGVSQVADGTPVAVMLTTYSTTLPADGTTTTRLRVAVTDSAGMEIRSATDLIRIYVTGDGFVTDPDGKELETSADTAGIEYAECRLVNGTAPLLFRTGTTPGRVKIEARADGMWPGGHEIHTLPADIVMLKPTPEDLPATTKPIDRMIGADISWLQEIESRGAAFFENGIEADGVKLLADHGFNYIRLRIFVNPENENGYSPALGFCNLDATLEMARRVSDAGMKLLLDFHYSDYWADPQQQNKPLAWADLDYESLKDALKKYTSMVLKALEQQGTPPAMVQIGNEINHGLLWPDGHISNLDGLAGLLRAGVEGVEAVDPDMPVMMHIALGGQNDEAVFWLDNMLARGVKFDIIGLSYYPRWHGTLNDLNYNLHDLVKRYNKPVNVVEYSNFKKEVHDIVFALPENMGKGACIWEPLNRRSGLFDEKGEVTPMMQVYDMLNETYLK
ncbi:MAG: glycosyl hydrolase 53 family protein [Bacteroidales bacterium]